MAYLLTACLLLFVARLPLLVRVSEGVETLPGQQGAEFTQLSAYAFFGALMVLPLILYGLAAVSHLVARAAGGQGSWYSARLALFWSLLASAPLALLYGLARGMLGPGAPATFTGALWLAGFALIWTLSLSEAERP